MFFLNILFFWAFLPFRGGCAVLDDFAVAQPPVVPLDAKQCTVLVLQRDFAFSFGSAEVVQFDPPTDCGPVGSWAAITLNFTATINGTQFDRLGIFTFQNVEIWRTSTFEPTRGDGIAWTYIKDVSQYIPLFSEPGTFILQLDNLIQTGLDGIYSTTLYATYYESSSVHPPASKADLIVPISTLANDTGNDASVPPSLSRNITLPNNTVQVYAELFASGNGQEEDWFFNVADRFFPDIPPGLTSGQVGRGPFREVRLLIDDRVAGVAFPYAVIFTGGFVPSMWRPIAAHGAIELPTYFLDVTPFVPILVDGKPHNFTIDVVSAESNHTINQNWFVSGLLQVVTDSSQLPTTGNITRYEVEPFAKASTSGRTREIGDVDVNIEATRSVHIESEIRSGSGEVTHVVWTQNLQYSNFQTYRDNATVQTLQQRSSGKMSSTHNGVQVVADVFSYPFDANFTFLFPDQQNWTSSIDHSYQRSFLPNPLRVASKITERQTTSGFFQLASPVNFGNGTNNNSFSYIDSAGNTYKRIVNAAFNNITFDEVSGTLANEGPA
ncbi:hypothetical protein D9758_003342 [Tetrapyrgos nigripes]|uniref:Peptide N-acetyl-beta-D-glucosaminyl asparaginase amidase A N-terminal domain-containing protein n=1 Tax=Tetrapyrgos nigripes TaxID=182062 RepID=A0A8H5GJ91_9AGAR|nr:hypothetical protein D9758_003342 [Tetrapyrgos nigripes]